MIAANNDAVQFVLETACRKGKCPAEVFFIDGQEFSIQAAEQKVENMELAQERGVGLRVFSNHQLGYAYSSDFSRGALERMVDMALSNAAQVKPDENWELPQSGSSYPDLSLYDEDSLLLPVEKKIDNALRMEAAARSIDKRLTITEKAVYMDSSYQIVIMNSLGLNCSYRGSYCGAYMLVVAQEGEESQTGFDFQYEIKGKHLDYEKIGRQAGKKAVRMLGARNIPSAKMPVVLDPYVGTSLLGVLQLPLSAEAVLKGKSFLQGMEGKKVADELIEIVDDGTLEGRLGSSPFDGEGVPASETVLIKEGCLQGFLHNCYTAKRFMTASTGNAVRGTYKSTPEIGVTNFYLKPGKSPANILIQDIKRGLYITEVMGMHTANPISGDFSLGASGLLIENGELTSPVKGVAVAGNLKELLKEIEAVGNDLTFIGSKGAPTLRIKSMSIGGS